MIKNTFFVLGFLMSSIYAWSSPPKRVIFFMIDGLHCQAPDRLELNHFNALRSLGVYVQKSYMITPHHPTVGDYGKNNTSSFPNPVLHQGTIFIDPANKMIQEALSQRGPTAFLTNTNAYSSITRGFNIVFQIPGSADEDIVSNAISILDEHDIVFMRIHLQTAGNEGRYLSYTTPDKPYYRNIWGDGSPYIKALKNADEQLGRFIKHLQSTNKWDSTLLIVFSDNGQSEIGWHMMIDEDSWRCPLVCVGPSVAQGKILSYFEHTDLAATVCDFMDVKGLTENGGSGVSRKQAFTTSKPVKYEKENIRVINSQINDYNRLKAQIMLAADSNKYMSSYISFLENELLTPEPFYHQDRFTEWYKAGTTQHLIDNNAILIEEMRSTLKNR